MLDLRLLFLAFLTFWLVWMDWRHGKIPVLGLVLLIGIGLVKGPELISSFVLGMATLLSWRLGYCGSGDVYLLLACGLWIPLALLPFFCILAGIFVFIFGMPQRKSHQRQFPLAPPVLLALWVIVFLPN